MPLRASLWICSSTSAGVVLSQDGALREYGRAEDAMPLPGVCIRPMAGGFWRVVDSKFGV